MNRRPAAHTPGLTLPVKVHPKARQNAITGVHDGRLKIQVTAAPERGKANDAVIDMLAEFFGLPASAVTVLRGETQPEKLLHLHIDPAAAVARLKAAGFELPTAPPKNG